MTTARCPFCGALLDVAWSKAHAPHCPSRQPEPDDAVVLAAVLDVDRALARLEAYFRAPEPPDYRIPQEEDEP